MNDNKYINISGLLINVSHITTMEYTAETEQIEIVMASGNEHKFVLEDPSVFPGLVKPEPVDGEEVVVPNTSFLDLARLE